MVFWKIYFVFKDLIEICFNKLHDDTDDAQLRDIWFKWVAIVEGFSAAAAITLYCVRGDPATLVFTVLDLRADDVNELWHELIGAFKLEADLIEPPHQLDLSDDLDGIILGIGLVFHDFELNDSSSCFSLTLWYASIATLAHHLN